MANPFREYESDPGWQYLKQPDEIRMKEQARPYDSKKNVWIPDSEEGFIEAEIKSTKGDIVTVTSVKGDTNIKKDLVQEMNPPKFDKCEDMSNLSFLNDASVLGNLRSRYKALLIYTYSGLFCVVINPYKRIPIYTESVACMYMAKRRNEMPPHLFAVSDEAYRNMLRDRENQSMLITGESGAGKTENTKKVISYFASVGSSQAEKVADADKKKVSLEDQIVQTNPVLEAFGNAKTVRNNNSSRFGKFIRIHFSGGGKVAGCDIENYLLEKSRVIRQAPGERCYHIFYQIFTNGDLRKTLLLDQELAYYHFVSQAELTIAGVDDTEEFGLTDEAFDILMFSAEEKLNCFKLMSAHMHLGEMKFRPKSSKDEQAEQDGEDEAIKAADMLGVNCDEFLKAITSPRVKVGTEWVHKGQNCQQVHWSVGALVKGQYARIFSWLVAKCNETLDAKALERKFFVGVLDIAGFEIFDFNSFEQIWINFVNEKLQQFFNHHMFVLEQEEYKREGIQWVFIDFGLDLAACIELIEKPLGIISMLDEECIVPKASDTTYAQKLCDQHLGKHPNFQKPRPPKGKQAEAHFALAHYAGIVRYNVLNWLEKNKDPLNDTAIQVFKNGKTNKLVPLIWADFVTMEEQALEAKSGGGGKKRGKSASMMTVSMLYRESLNNLMSMLNKTHPHFVRCIIPNEKKQSGLLDASLVMNQLTCNGVLEGIRICKKGFPNRTLHIDFRQRYALLAAKAAEAEDPKVASDGILKTLVKAGKMVEDNYRVGHTKVFFKAGILAHMEDLRDEKLSEIFVGMQAQMRWNLALVERKRRQNALDSYTVVQSNIRNWSNLRNWPWYTVYGWLRPMLGRTQQEIKKLGKQIEDMQETLKTEEGKRGSLEAEVAELERKMAELEKELDLRRNNSNLSSEKAAKIESETKALNSQVEGLNNVVTGLEDKNGEMKRGNDKLNDETSELKRQQKELETLLRETEEDRKREAAITALTDDGGKAEALIAQLTRDNKDLATSNWRLKDEIQSHELMCTKLLRDRGNLGVKAEDLQALLDKEDRNRSGLQNANKSLADELQKALEKVEALTSQCNDAESHMKQKEQDVKLANERLRDEGHRVSRLEHQLIDLAGAFNNMGRR